MYEIRKYQKFIDFFISKTRFERFVREILHDVTKKNVEFDDIIEDFRIQRVVLKAFQKTTKNYIIFVLSNKCIIFLHYFKLIFEIVNFFQFQTRTCSLRENDQYVEYNSNVNTQFQA